MIENRNLEVGTRLVARYKKEVHVCTVEAEEEGEGIVFALADGKKFKSPSAAGSHIMGGKAVNGWRFWSLEGEAATTAAEPATKAIRSRTKANSANKPAKAQRKRKERTKPATKLIRAHDDQTDVPEGMLRIVCLACTPMVQVVEGFAVPEVCPAGHRIDDPQYAGDLEATESAEGAPTE